MNLEKSYRIVLTDRKTRKGKTRSAKLVQYVEAENMDAAIIKARNTFFARLHGFDTCAGSESQKACNTSSVRDSLKFGFKSGWVTIHGGENVFAMKAEAERMDFLKGAKIDEIHALCVDGARV
jgi:hypothetical protein